MDKNRVLIIVVAVLIITGFVVHEVGNRYTPQNNFFILDRWTGHVYRIDTMKK